MDINEIKQGSRVTYAIGEVEYDAVALGSVTTGVNKAIQAPGFFLTLRYLNEQGTPVTIFGAPLLGVESDNVVARDRMDKELQGVDADDDLKDEVFDKHLSEIKANPRTTGWLARPANLLMRPEPQVVQPAPDHEIAQVPRIAPAPTMGLAVPTDIVPSSNSLIAQTGYVSADPEGDASKRYEEYKAQKMAESMADAGEPLGTGQDAQLPAETTADQPATHPEAAE